MNGSINPIIILSKISGVFPLSLNPKNVLMKVLVNVYVVVLLILYALTIKTRSVFTNEMATKMSQVTAVGMRIRSMIPVLAIVSLLTGNYSHRQKMREIVNQMREFDEKVSENQDFSWF